MNERSTGFFDKQDLKQLKKNQFKTVLWNFFVSSNSSIQLKLEKEENKNLIHKTQKTKKKNIDDKTNMIFNKIIIHNKN